MYPVTNPLFEDWNQMQTTNMNLKLETKLKLILKKLLKEMIAMSRSFTHSYLAYFT